MKKKILIALGALALFVIGSFISIIVIFVARDLIQEKRLEDDLVYINDLFNVDDINEKEIRQRLRHYVTTGDNLKVEKAVKAYYNDALDYAITLSELLNDERLTSSLSIYNFRIDGPDFVRTKLYINNAKKGLEDVKIKITQHMTEKKKMSYLRNKDFDSYDVDLYKEMIINFDFFGKDIKEAEDSIQSVIDNLDKIDKVIEFLILNKGKWQIIGSNIIFLDESLIPEFNGLLNSFSYNGSLFDEDFDSL